MLSRICHPTKIIHGRVLSVMVLTAALLGCGAPETEIRTVVDFMEDPDATEMKLINCRADRRAAVRDVECTNARTAANRMALEEEREAFKRLKEEAATELEQIRSERSRLEQALTAREEALKARAESKIAEGKTLTAEEARAIGIDPRGSLLVNPKDGGRDDSANNDDTGEDN